MKNLNKKFIALLEFSNKAIKVEVEVIDRIRTSLGNTIYLVQVTDVTCEYFGKISLIAPDNLIEAVQVFQVVEYENRNSVLGQIIILGKFKTYQEAKENCLKRSHSYPEKDFDIIIK
jgi:hypothetical protein